MTRTNWNRSSKVALATLLVVLAATVPAAAVSVGGEDVPNSAESGTQITATVTLDTLYQNPQLESWQLAGETDLTKVSWTVIYYDQTDSKVGQDEFTGQEFSGANIVADDGTAKVEVRITGTVPAIEDFSYDPPQQFLLMDLTQTQQGGASNDIDSWQVHHYTQRSQSARQAIDDAAAAIDDAEASGANPQAAKSDYQNAVAAYNDGSFDVATNLAQSASQEAKKAKQGAQTQQTAIYAVGGLVVLAILAGGGYLWWRSQQDDYDKLG
ncbi:MAG: hypothetical protein ABEJ82_04765 [Haloplanus sp.]